MSKYQQQNWIRKFANAFRGIRIVFSTQNSIWIQVPIALIVSALAFWLNVSWVEGVALGICVTIVLTAEMMNTAIEFLSREVTDKESRLVRDSLDAAAGGVLVASIGSAIVGLVILLPKLLTQIGIVLN